MEDKASSSSAMSRALPDMLGCRPFASMIINVPAWHCLRALKTVSLPAVPCETPGTICLKAFFFKKLHRPPLAELIYQRMAHEGDLQEVLRRPGQKKRADHAMMTSTSMEAKSGRSPPRSICPIPG